VKITILTESLGSGGAERRACSLATSMKEKGHHVKVITFYAENHFAEILKNAGVEHLLIRTSNKFSRVLKLRKVLKEESPHAVLAFLSSSSLAAKLASLPSRPWGLVVSEGSTILPQENRKTHWDRRTHKFADYVIANSHTTRLIMEKFYSNLKGRIITIYNPVNLNIFQFHGINKSDVLKFVTAASINPIKNAMGLIKGLGLLHDKGILKRTEFNWYGSAPKGSTYLKDCRELVVSKKLQDKIHFHEPVVRIDQIYRQADAVLLPSFREGLPNTICEALACGLPVLMSSVCDAGNLVKDHHNGFLFDPNSVDSIAEAIHQFQLLSHQQRAEMGKRSREIAEKWLDLEVVVEKYLEVLWAAAQRRRLTLRHWPTEVPQTAEFFLQSVTMQDCKV
jgi:glycosyltransferase involved in cell wall biosynthesis